MLQHGLSWTLEGPDELSCLVQQIETSVSAVSEIISPPEGRDVLEQAGNTLNIAGSGRDRHVDLFSALIQVGHCFDGLVSTIDVVSSC